MRKRRRAQTKKRRGPATSKKKIRVLIACCNGRGWIHKTVVFKVIAMLQDRRFESQFIAPTWSPLEHSQHRVIKDFLEQGFDFLLFVDDDNPPNKNPLDLVLHNLDVMGLPTPVWCAAKEGERPFYYNALREGDWDDGQGYRPLQDQPGFKPGGLQECDAHGGGCLLIARRVLEELWTRAEEGRGEYPFMRKWEKGRPVVGNDYSFCRRVKEAGFQIWTHFDYTCKHINELEIQETVSALLGMED